MSAGARKNESPDRAGEDLSPRRRHVRAGRRHAAADERGLAGRRPSASARRERPLGPSLDSAARFLVSHQYLRGAELPRVFEGGRGGGAMESEADDTDRLQPAAPASRSPLARWRADEGPGNRAREETPRSRRCLRRRASRSSIEPIAQHLERDHDTRAEHFARSHLLLHPRGRVHDHLPRLAAAVHPSRNRTATGRSSRDQALRELSAGHAAHRRDRAVLSLRAMSTVRWLDHQLEFGAGPHRRCPISASGGPMAPAWAPSADSPPAPGVCVVKPLHLNRRAAVSRLPSSLRGVVVTSILIAIMLLNNIETGYRYVRDTRTTRERSPGSRVRSTPSVAAPTSPRGRSGRWTSSRSRRKRSS